MLWEGQEEYDSVGAAMDEAEALIARWRKTTWREFIKSHWNVLAACDFFSVELLIKGRLIRYMVLFAIDVATRKVEILGIRPKPNGPWMEQAARNVSGEGGSLRGRNT